MLIENIGTAAMLEQTAEECVELSQACLKLARLIRGENPVYKDAKQIIDNLHEEIADVRICIGELVQGEAVNDYEVQYWTDKKMERCKKRLKGA